MIRLAFAGLAMLSLAKTAAAEEDYGPALVDLFNRTCILRPALPSEMARIASGPGFVSEGGAITADMEKGPRIDVLYSAKLTKQDGKVAGLTAYFDGPADGPTVTCTVTATGVSPEALPGLIEKSLKARDRIEKEAADGKRLVANWRLDEAGHNDMLEMSARRDAPLRASITLTYRGGKH